MRLIFMGTPHLACASLEALIARSEFQVVGVVTQPDRPVGRDLKVRPSPVKESAQKSGLSVLQPERARNEAFIDELRRLKPDLIAVTAYGQILPQAILDLPRFGCLNVHTSLLPKYRGAAPIQWAILNDEPQTGVTIMKMDAGMDTGPILAQEKTPINPEDTAETLHDRLAAMGAGLLVDTIPGYVSGSIAPQAQPAEGVAYAPRIKKEDGRINWTLPARAIWNRVRGLRPWPGAFTVLPVEGSPTLKIWTSEVAADLQGNSGEILRAAKSDFVVACGKQALRILEVQIEGGKRLVTQQFLAGHHLRPGQRLGSIQLS